MPKAKRDTERSRDAAPASRSRRRERGAAAVEMALVLPLLLLVVGGIMDLGRMYYTKELLTNAAREGARVVAVGYTTADADTRISQAKVNIDLGTTLYEKCNDSTGVCSASATPCPATPISTDSVRVTVTTPTSPANKKFTFFLITPMSRFFGGSLDAPILTGSSSMRCGG